MASSEAADNTVNPGDSLVGGAGTDTLNINVAGSLAAAGAGLATSGIETLGLSNNGSSDVTVDGTLLAGLKTVKVTGGQNATTVNNLDGIVDLNLVSTSKNVTAASVAAATVGTADSVTVTLNSVARNGSVDVTYNGVEAMKVVTTGTASGSVAATGAVEYDVEFKSADLNTVTVTGSAGLVATVGFDRTEQTVTQVNTFDASGLNAAVNVTVLNAGNSGLLSVKGSASADTVDVSDLTITDKMTVVGGDGADTLVLGGTGLATAATSGTQKGANISGFEVLKLDADASVSVAALGTNAFTSATLSGAGTVTKANAELVTINQTGSGAIVYGRATDGTADALTVNLSNLTAGFTSSLTASGEETITINSNSAAASTVALSAAAATKLVVTGKQNTSVTTDAATVALATVDASAVTGTSVAGTTAFTLDASANTKGMTVTGSTGGVNSITTGSGADSVTGGSGSDVLNGGLGADTLSGGDGNDTINGGTGSDSILGGAGNDVITADTGNDYIDGGDGNDQIDAGAGADTVVGGAGNDQIAVTLSDSTSVDGGDGTDRVAATSGTITSTTPSSVNGAFITVAEDAAPKLTSVETLYASITAPAVDKGLDLTAASSLTSLFLETAAVATKVTNYAGSSVRLYGATTDAVEATTLLLDGVGQSSLTVGLEAYDGATDLTVTGVGALTIEGRSTSQFTGSADQDNELDDVSAAAVNSLTIRSTGSAAANADALVLDDITATNATSITLSAGTNDQVKVGDISASNDGVETLSVTVGTDAKLGIENLELDASKLATATVTVGAGGILTANGAAGGSEVDVNAAKVSALTVTLNAGAEANLDLTSVEVTSGTLTVDSAGLLKVVNTLGLADKASSFTFSGRGDVDFSAGVQLAGSVVSFDTTGLTTDAEGFNVTGGSGNDTIKTNLGNDVLSGGIGEDVLNGGLGADTLTGGADNDSITLSETVSSADVVVVNASATASDSKFVEVAAGTATKGNDAGGDTITGFNVAADVLKVVATGVVGYDHTSTNSLAVGGATADLQAGTTGAAGEFAANTVLMSFNNTADFNDASDIVINLASSVNGTTAITTLARADIAAAIQYDLTGTDAANTIVGGSLADTITGGAGADRLTGGAGLDSFVLAAGDTALTVSLGTSGSANSSISGMDIITDFGKANGTVSSETLNVAGTAAKATAGTLDIATTSNVVAYSGTAGGTSTTFASVVINSDGIAVFHNNDVPNAPTTTIAVTAANLAGAISSLQGLDIGSTGSTVAFALDYDGNGTADLAVFTQGSDAGTDNSLDNLVILLDVGSVTSLITTNATTANALFIA